jgi:hypothetical protein
MNTKSIVVAAFALISSVALANEPGNPRVVVISQKQSGTFKVIYEGEKTGNVQMNISNAAGKVIFSETIKGVDGFIRPVNFMGMEPGEYSIEVIDAKGKQIQKVTYVNENVVKNVHVAKIADEGKYLLAVANQDAEQINVKIFDGTNQLVHNENLTVSGNLGLVYNLKNVTGTPTFEVTDKTGNVRTITTKK